MESGLLGHRELHRLAGDHFVRRVRQFDQHLERARFQADQDHRFAARWAANVPGALWAEALAANGVHAAMAVRYLRAVCMRVPWTEEMKRRRVLHSHYAALMHGAKTGVLPRPCYADLTWCPSGRILRPCG
jgi:hypothetical protein